MRTICVHWHFDADPDTVFDAVTDHAALATVPGVASAQVVRPGDTEPNGAGAIREVNARAAWFREEITEFERPRRMGYRILKARPPVRHEFGRIELTPTADGTLVIWISRFGSSVPVLGPIIELVTGFAVARAFQWMLLHTERRIKAAAETG
ncbi:SRPBCC family protein [Nocardia sp. NPDC127579]|uniref:SRPBCC family protein n=1 Tax=Nocardia sp. NPDC127579 TaxID=3345402 RepID=UPI0036358437